MNGWIDRSARRLEEWNGVWTEKINNKMVSGFLDSLDFLRYTNIPESTHWTNKNVSGNRGSARTVGGFKDDGGSRDGRRGQSRAVHSVDLHLQREGQLRVEHILRGDVCVMQSVSDVIPAAKSEAFFKLKTLTQLISRTLLHEYCECYCHNEIFIFKIFE